MYREMGYTDTLMASFCSVHIRNKKSAIIPGLNGLISFGIYKHVKIGCYAMS